MDTPWVAPPILTTEGHRRRRSGGGAADTASQEWPIPGKSPIPRRVGSVGARRAFDHLARAWLRGDVAATVSELTGLVRGLRLDDEARAAVAEQRLALEQIDNQARDAARTGQGLDPAAVVLKLRELVDDDATVVSDVGSHSICMARHFSAVEDASPAREPRRVAPTGRGRGPGPPRAVSWAGAGAPACASRCSGRMLEGHGERHFVVVMLGDHVHGSREKPGDSLRPWGPASNGPPA